VLKLTEDYPGYIYAALGIHPNYSADCELEHIARLEELAAAPGVVAIGEIGLDYYRDYSPRSSSAALSSGSWNWPPAWRCRSSFTTGMPRRTGPNPARLAKRAARLEPDQTTARVMHAYSSSAEQALALAEIGFYFGIGGPITYQNAQERRGVVKQLPLERSCWKRTRPSSPHTPQGQTQRTRLHPPHRGNNCGAAWHQQR
jgi:TatD DNase family protein